MSEQPGRHDLSVPAGTWNHARFFETHLADPDVRAVEQQGNARWVSTCRSCGEALLLTEAPTQAVIAHAGFGFGAATSITKAAPVPSRIDLHEVERLLVAAHGDKLCDVCTGRSPIWDGHDQDCRTGALLALRDRVVPALATEVAKARTQHA